ncbi:MAG: hypothetical protein HZA89_04930 [Verrucomicrobia bacterium]|nr:hypothetical protein [Verrucomicrobiota bacterium]
MPSASGAVSLQNVPQQNDSSRNDAVETEGATIPVAPCWRPADSGGDFGPHEFTITLAQPVHDHARGAGREAEFDGSWDNRACRNSTATSRLPKAATSRGTPN